MAGDLENHDGVYDDDHNDGERQKSCASTNRRRIRFRRRSRNPSRHQSLRGSWRLLRFRDNRRHSSEQSRRSICSSSPSGLRLRAAKISPFRLRSRRRKLFDYSRLLSSSVLLLVMVTVAGEDWDASFS